MSETLQTIIRDASRPLAPLPTEVAPRLPSLAGIRAVLFDIYGTLLVSGSGDIGAADPTIRGRAFSEALAAVGLDYHGDADAGAVALRETIEVSHSQSRAAGVEFPEVDIVAVWRATCERLAAEKTLVGSEATDYERLAVEFEVRANPVWPMPDLTELLTDLGKRGMVLGIISNAQFFTPLVFPALCGGTLDGFGFHPGLRYYSYATGEAKPGKALYERAASDLTEQTQPPIAPREVLYVGNDLRNDIWPAAAVGFRTALFAGDRRSLRLREEQPDRESMPEPDAIVTQLNQVSAIIGN